MQVYYIDDSPGIRVSDIRSKCRRLKQEHGLGMIIIDYLQLIQGSERLRENRQQEVSEISRSLKSLARELRSSCHCVIAIIAKCRINVKINDR